MAGGRDAVATKAGWWVVVERATVATVAAVAALAATVEIEAVVMVVGWMGEMAEGKVMATAAEERAQG